MPVRVRRCRLVRKYCGSHPRPWKHITKETSVKLECQVTFSISHLSFLIFHLNEQERDVCQMSNGK